MKFYGGCLTSAAMSIVLLVPGQLRAETTAQAAFDRLTRLAGEWRAQVSEGQAATANYKLVSNGSVLMEELATPGGGSMITMYHLDGDNLILTHYCGAKNQPRMKADLLASSPGELKFKFLDITNLPDQNAGHMRELTVTFQDDTHMSQSWTFRKDGKDQAHPFRYVRAR